MLPTPRAADWRSGHVSDDVFDRNARPLCEVVARATGGPALLKPEPVEWMMGWPAGWTEAEGPSLLDAPAQVWEDWWPGA